MKAAVSMFLSLLPLAAAAGSAPPAPAYAFERSIPLGAGERWDYATWDAATGRVYVAHGDHVTVVDVARHAVIGDIGKFPGGTHGVDLAPGDDVGFTDDGRAGTVAAFDPQSLRVTATIAAAPDADGIVFDPASRHVFVVDGDSGSITVIDPKTRAAIATIEVGAALEAGVADGNGHLYVDGVEQHDLVVIDTRTNAVVAHVALPGCERPHGIAVDAATQRVFATCINKVGVFVDAAARKVVATLPIGALSDGAAFDAKRRRFVSSNGEGTLSVIEEKDADHFVALPDVATRRSARTMTIDPESGRLFLPAARVASVEAPQHAGGRPRVTYEPGSLELLVYAPVAAP